MHALYGYFNCAVCTSASYMRCLVTHRYTSAPFRSITLKYREALILLSVSLENDLAEPVFDGVILAGFKSRANGFFCLSC